jgi:hypothetical protein
MQRSASYAMDIGFLAIFIAISFWFLLFIRRWYGKIIPLLCLCVIVLVFIFDKNFAIPFIPRPIITLADLRGPEVEIASFARGHIREDAVFLTPPLFGQFRITARRAIVVDFRWFPFHDLAMVEWRRRLSDCYGEAERAGFKAAFEMDRSYRAITDKKLIYIAKKYGSLYAVLYKETPTPFPILFENDTYKIVKIEAEP